MSNPKIKTASLSDFEVDQPGEILEESHFGEHVEWSLVSVFATLKKELIYREHYKTKAQARKAIFEYIEVWYNRNRLHSSLGYRSPAQFEEAYAA